MPKKSPLSEAALLTTMEPARRLYCGATREIGGGNCARKDYIGMY